MEEQFIGIADRLKQIADSERKAPLITYIDERTFQPIDLFAKDLYERGQRVAHSLIHDHGLKAGDNVVLNYPQGIEFVEAFIGCIFAGLVPAPVSPPMPVKTEMGFPNYTNIVHDSHATAQLTCKRYTESRSYPKILEVLKHVNQLKDIPWIETDDLAHNPDGQKLEPVKRDADDVAFLQYTSGSTRAPRGVQLTFRNVFVQLNFLRDELGLKPERTSVFWMPHYHDFSLIGGILDAVYGYHHLVLMSPLLFLKKPAVWFELASRYKATVLTGPNFGYNYMTERTTPEERASWDLSSVEKVICAAEPIRPHVIENFYKAFEVSKLNPNSFSAAYGMAEHTIAVSLNGQKVFTVPQSTLSGIEGDSEEIKLMSCGIIGHDIEVKIVNPETNEVLPEGTVGEIWISSPHIGKGYYDKPEMSKAKFEGRIEGSDKNWLKSGDFGLLLEGELVCTGRMDDMIIVRGQNIYPQDVEEMAIESSEYIRAGRAIAFGDDSKEETVLCVVVELAEDKETGEYPEKKALYKISAGIRELLFRQLGLASAHIIYTQKGIIPKTTSGKLQRSKCKKLWKESKIPAVFHDTGLLT
jgi:acyl-CoA synthetase (AMP-forming)/AMP-acid ligase II